MAPEVVFPASYHGLLVLKGSEGETIGTTIGGYIRDSYQDLLRPPLPQAPVRQEVVNAIALPAGKPRGPSSGGPLLHCGGGGLSEG